MLSLVRPMFGINLFPDSPSVSGLYGPSGNPTIFNDAKNKKGYTGTREWKFSQHERLLAVEAKT